MKTTKQTESSSNGTTIKKPKKINPEEKEKEQPKNRQLTGKKVGISIKDILKSKK